MQSSKTDIFWYSFLASGEGYIYVRIVGTFVQEAREKGLPIIADPNVNIRYRAKKMEMKPKP